MIAETTTLPGVLLIKRDIFEDHRGFYTQLYQQESYEEIFQEHIGSNIMFLEDDIAVSSKHVLRGFHGDNRTWKLVTCLSGKFYIVIATCKPGNDFGKWQSFILSEGNGHQLLVPPLHGNAYLVMSDSAIFHYKQSCIYKGAVEQFTYRYDDPRFNVWWPVKEPILSLRDDHVPQ